MTGVKGLIVTVSAVMCALALIGIAALGAIQNKSITELRKDLREPHYEYKVMSFGSEGHDRTGDGAMRYTTIDPSESALSKLGASGWEVVGTYLEMETAYPNFGKAEYVTGLQPNIRPQRVVLVLRQRLA